MICNVESQRFLTGYGYGQSEALRKIITKFYDKGTRESGV